MKTLRICGQGCILLLMADALAVCLGLLRRRDMWPWIVGYWAILTIKNALDFLRERMEDKSKWTIF